MNSEISVQNNNNHNNIPIATTIITNESTNISSVITTDFSPPTIGIVSDSEHNSNSSSNSSSPSRRSSRRTIKNKNMTDVQEAPQPRNVTGSDEEENTKPQKSGKSRRELPAGAVATLKAWLLSPEHFTHPYPTPQDQVMLMQKTGIDKKQLKNWFTNARRRIWKPMLKKQLEQGKMAQTGSGAVVALTPGATVITAAPPGADYTTTVVDHSQVMQQNFQQALQTQNSHTQQQPQQQTQQQYDTFGGYQQQQQQQTQQQQQQQQQQPTFNNSSYYQQNQYNTQTQQQSNVMAPSNSIGSLPQMPGATPPGSMSNLNKTDSHAVLMELFARDQDLVRQATRLNAQSSNGNDQNNQQGMNGQFNGTSQLGSQHPMSKMATGGSSTLNKLGNVSSLNSWPHFSSVSSLNNLGTMTGVKSITNMSGADLVSQGSLNQKGNLAQVKSIENMGRADSYAFLEVFFDNAGSSSSTQTQRGVKREREEDENVGLSLDGDEQSPPTSNPVNSVGSIKAETVAPVAAPLQNDGQDKDGLKRAYDDALAARGLISVSRSSEKLTDLALPAKMQRTISQEYLKSMNSGAPTTFTSFSFNTAPAPATQSIPQNQGLTTDNTISTQQQFSHPGQQNQQPQQQNQTQQTINTTTQQPQYNNSCKVATSNATTTNSPVEVPATTKCAICNCINVDTQLRPCGCMFHGRCLKPSLQNAVGPPRCPIDHITMQSAVLAIPTDENANNNSSNNMVNNGTSTSYSTPTPLAKNNQEVTNTSSV